MIEQQKQEEIKKCTKQLSPKLPSSIQCILYVPANPQSKGGIPKSQVWCGTSEGVISIWDAASGSHIENINAHNGQIFSLILIQDFVWSCSIDSMVKIFPINNPKRVKKELKNYQIMCFCRVGKVVWGGSTETYVHIFDPKKGSHKKKFKAIDNGPITCMTYLQDYGHVWCGTDYPGKSIIRVQSKNGKPVDSIEGHSKKVNQLIQSGSFVWSCSHDRTIRLWNPESGQCLRLLQGHLGPVFNLFYALDNIWSASWDKSIMIWDAETQTFFKDYTAHTDAVSCICFVKETQTIWTGSWDKSIITWKLI
eukprot:TRINITY_DN9495_c0_g1_i1.p1 TRINITY_DN9495_c0_g1~~TRINITY_DN9495_c0_g1_i1.p1  ORF type:complete len:336 (+),score=133.52 TRINITY_DN9495_c0_g1_i1:85-1008(+)